MKKLIAALVAGAFALGSVSTMAADSMDSPKETKTQKTKKYVKKKARAVKAKAKRGAQKVKAAVANRTTTDPASPSETGAPKK